MLVQKNEIKFKYVELSKMKDDNYLSKSAQQILDYLCFRPYESYYGAQIADQIRLSKGGTNELLKQLRRQGFLSAKQQGRMIFYTADAKSALVKQYKVLRNLFCLNKLIKKVSPFSSRIVLFGSAAEGDDDKSSDIDLLVVTDSKEEVLKCVAVWKQTDRKIQLILKSTQEFFLFEKKEPVFSKEIAQGIILWQTE